MSERSERTGRLRTVDPDVVHMHIDGRPGVTDDYTWGPQTRVYRAAGKVFLMVGVRVERQYVTYKSDPADALSQRDAHPAVTPGYYANKKHWNTVYLDGSVPGDLILDWIDESYDLVVAGLPRKVRDELRAG
jgi:predicted DNA-binding protein (MmcQ/YjbR family)